jgi:hypothetical protein
VTSAGLREHHRHCGEDVEDEEAGAHSGLLYGMGRMGMRNHVEVTLFSNLLEWAYARQSSAFGGT